jgi:two-component system sensor histidine kinase ComP
MHTNQQKYIDSSLGTTELLQAKLFNNLEKEKTKYTHYLHDSVLQSVIGLHTLVSNLHGDDEIESLVRIEFSKLIRSIRDEVFNISPSTLYYLSFEENIQILIEDFNHKYPEIEYLLIYQLNGELPKHLVAPVYRVIKELNENIGKTLTSYLWNNQNTQQKKIFYQ